MTKWETCVDPSGGLESRGLDGQSPNNVFNTLVVVVQGLYIANTRTRRKWKARHFPGDAFSLKSAYPSCVSSDPRHTVLQIRSLTSAPSIRFYGPK
ncbi:hypothetical protein NC653_014046 [Populus alba x Populus x berolinensis]|uniref:Uncharacterized protein n=1 Tax=Populus alba x Populus x berolinensis TaxID=444605 RepID=A0AAD6QVY8_9ROSI|nr:hypothetical protein NC653_014046 [Populus alba x Populus x berolinensis]